MAFQRAGDAGFEAQLVTFTMPHRAGTTLGEEIDAFSVAWRQYSCGRRAMSLRRGSLGNHVGRECTWSAANGWHYHHHQLRYDEPGSFVPDTARADWLAALESVGRRTEAAELRAFDCGVVGTEAGARYVAKLATSVEAQGRAVGLEVAAGALKGRNMATLLRDAANGDDAAEWVWVKGVCDVVERKVSSVRWSRGLRAKVGLSVEKSDVEVAQEEVLVTDVFLGGLSHAQWRGVLAHQAEFALCCAANQGFDSVNSFLAGLGLGQLDEAPRAAVEISPSEDNVYQRRHDVDTF